MGLCDSSFTNRSVSSYGVNASQEHSCYKVSSLTRESFNAGCNLDMRHQSPEDAGDRGRCRTGSEPGTGKVKRAQYSQGDSAVRPLDLVVWPCRGTDPDGIGDESPLRHRPQREPGPRIRPGRSGTDVCGAGAD